MYQIVGIMRFFKVDEKTVFQLSSRVFNQIKSEEKHHA